MTMKTFNFEEIPDFIIGRAGYDIWLVDYVVCHPEIVMVDTTNASRSLPPSPIPSSLCPPSVEGGQSLGHQAQHARQGVQSPAGEHL